MQQANIVIDLGFGDAGKGSIVDYLTRSRTSNLVIRFNGGPQAAHNVVTDSHHHTFRQFGAGTLAGARTLYLGYALLDPIMLLDEAKALSSKGIANPLGQFHVEGGTVITTIFQQAMNRIRETVRGENRHGSCGLGIGETASDSEDDPDVVLRVQDLKDRNLTHKKLERLRTWKLREALQLVALQQNSHASDADLAILKDSAYSKAAMDAYCNIVGMVNVLTHDAALEMLSASRSPIFEGAQGVLLDQDYGFYPYITRSHVAPWDAVSFCEEADVGYRVTGVTRAYAVRHGPGPLPTESDFLTEHVSDTHNKFGEWQRGFRVGYFDAVMTRLAIDICCNDFVGTGVDELFMTCTDRLSSFDRALTCNEYISYGSKSIILPQSMARIGKVKKREYTEKLSVLVPVYEEYDSNLDKNSLDYQIGYARHVLALVDRNVNLVGISRGPKASDKFLL